MSKFCQFFDIQMSIFWRVRLNCLLLSLRLRRCACIELCDYLTNGDMDWRGVSVAAAAPGQWLAMESGQLGGRHKQRSVYVFSLYQGRVAHGHAERLPTAGDVLRQRD